ncbi:MAG: IS5 family transposase [Hyphomicrobiales bacterium]|nr:IS5 family transposase [Hyphomicrobiales bacterium]
MPHKFNAARRHKFAKKRYRVTNWAEYNESLRRRGDLTVWIDADALELWTAPRRVSRGGQQRYSDMAITICLTLGLVYKQPLRQTQGLMRGIVGLMGLDISVPDFTTLSRRGRGLSLPVKPRTRRSEPVHLVVDSTGLKIFGEGEWLREKHKTKAKRRSWRKLHLGLDLLTGEIVCADLTLDNVGDSTALPGLLDQVDAPVSRFLADGAYDGAPTRNLLKARFGGVVEVIIPPPKNAIPSSQLVHDPSLRDRHIVAIQTHGRLAWQSSSGYNQRSRAEAQMGRWKGVIGPKLKARSFENQKTEVRIAVNVLNKMTELGRPEFEAVT